MASKAIEQALHLLNLHRETFDAIEPYATATGHPVPIDTRGWSQIIVSTLCGVKGLQRKKGADLDDGSDVKGANTWKAIDTPRFNGVIKAGTKAKTAGSIKSLDSMPHLYLVLWDETIRDTQRCRIWAVRPAIDRSFRRVCANWYRNYRCGTIRSINFQLHPPRGKDTNIINNACGNLEYPLYFCAERAPSGGYVLVHFDRRVLSSGLCRRV